MGALPNISLDKKDNTLMRSFYLGDLEIIKEIIYAGGKYNGEYWLSDEDFDDINFTKRFNLLLCTGQGINIWTFPSDIVQESFGRIKTISYLMFIKYPNLNTLYEGIKLSFDQISFSINRSICKIAKDLKSTFNNLTKEHANRIGRSELLKFLPECCFNIIHLYILPFEGISWMDHRLLYGD